MELDWFQITFDHFSPLAQSVSLVGDFNGWLPMEMEKDVNGKWSIQIRLLEGFYLYKFFVDGRWEIDEKNPHREHNGYNNSVIFVNLDPCEVSSNFTPAEPGRTYRRPEASSNVFQTVECPLPESISSRGVPQRPLYVYLPPSYESQPLRRYPVLYVHDGQNVWSSTNAQNGQLMAGGWWLDEEVDRLWGREGGKSAQEFIVVGVPHNEVANHGNRKREYCPWKLRGGRQAAYVRFMVEAVKPCIDRRFRTLPCACSTATMGSSMGGLLAFVLAVTCPDVFGAAACLSPSFWFIDSTGTSVFDFLREQTEKARGDGTAAAASCALVAGRAQSRDTAAVAAAAIAAADATADTSVSSSSVSSGGGGGGGEVDEGTSAVASPSAVEVNVGSATVAAGGAEVEGKAAEAEQGACCGEQPAPDGCVGGGCGRPIRLYVDSGDGPGDNMMETKQMARLLAELGWDGVASLGGGAAAGGAALPEWACPVCTLHNEAGMGCCAICGTPNPSPPPTQSIAVSVPVVDPTASAMYYLDQCVATANNGITHCEEVWRRRLHLPLQFLFPLHHLFLPHHASATPPTEGNVDAAMAVASLHPSIRKLLATATASGDATFLGTRRSGHSYPLLCEPRDASDARGVWPRLLNSRGEGSPITGFLFAVTRPLLMTLDSVHNACASPPLSSPPTAAAAATALSFARLPLPLESESSSASMAGGVTAAASPWVCPWCSADNAASAAQCELCATANPCATLPAAQQPLVSGQQAANAAAEPSAYFFNG